MPIADAKYKRMNPENVGKAPLKRGVYALYKDRTLIYIGKASGERATIRAMLESHLAGDAGAPSTGATHYKREPSATPDVRQRDLLDEHVAAYGEPPRGNAAKV